MTLPDPTEQSPIEDEGDSPIENQDILDRIHYTVGRLGADGASRGDLKILSRTLVELRYAFKVFSKYRHRRKVTVFGSARTKPDEPPYKQGVQFGRSMAENDWLVVTGAAFGIMEAAHVGAGREMSMGLNIMLPFEQTANPIIDGDEKLVHMKYFFTRKLMFVKECDAVVCLPGGFGTLDEAMEMLTLLQTGKRNMAPVVLLDAPGGSYWKTFDAYIRSELAAAGLISPEDFSLYKVTDDCDEAVQECLRFFRGYHSMRYVRDTLVFRLNKRLTEDGLEDINMSFSDILKDGKFVQRDALPEEGDETDIADLPRLSFHFNRYNHGRLRQLVDRINEG